MGHRPLLLFAALLIVSLTVIGMLGRSVVGDLRVLSKAPNDDVSWRMSQLEVELLRLQSAAQAAMPPRTGALSDMRKRYDIFYSRVVTLRQSRFYPSLAEDVEARDNLALALGFLDRTTPLIDGDDAALRAALPRILQATEQLRPALRQLALSGVEVFTQQEAASRETLSNTLRRMAFGIAGLILVLSVVVTTLILLYRQMQAASQKSDIARSRFEAAVSSSLDAVLVVDTSGHIVEFNGAAQAVFGYSRDEALGADMSELIVPEHLREAHRAGLARFVRTGEKKVIDAGRLRLEGLRKSGDTFPVELSISMSEASGERVFVSFLRDITAEIEAEEALKTALEQAQESDKAKSKLLTVMSHEMRTPLNGILGSLDLMDHSTLDAEQARHLNAIALSGELLLSHVNDVLDLSKLNEDGLGAEAAVFDLRALIAGVVDGQRGAASARDNALSVAFLGDTGMETVAGHAPSLQRILVNLIGNAIKFTKEGDIHVEAERLAHDDMVEIRISDTGVGIAPENLERIFEEFVTVDSGFARATEGTGLGLAITRQLLTALGGHIEADSILGEGSLFTVTVPLPVATTLQDQGQRLASQSRECTLPQGFKALVVDDNAINRKILGDTVAQLGGEVASASSGKEAIALATARAFDILLLDISMPEIDGIETLSRIRAAPGPSATTPAVAVTAHAAEKDHARIMSADFTDLMVKPLNRATVQQMLSGIFGVTGSVRDAPDTDVPEYLLRFGPEKFAEALSETARDLATLHNQLRTAERLTDEVRQEAHRVSGSAAVLGQQDLWAVLKDVEACDDDRWHGSKDTLLARIASQETLLKQSAVSYGAA